MSGTPKSSWKDEIQQRVKWFEEQINEFEKLRSQNLNNAWAIVFAPLRNLFSIAKDYLDMIAQLREKLQSLEERIEQLEEKAKS